MKSRKLIVLLVLFSLLTVLVPSAAADGGPMAGVWFAGSGTWTIPCASPEPGMVVFQIDLDIPATYIASVDQQIKDSTGTYAMSASFPQPETNSFNTLAAFFVPADAEVSFRYNVYAPDGTFLTTSEIYASCITGEIRVSFVDVYGMNEPAANQRVAATVLTNTPVYSTPGTVLPDLMLKAGQSWFVVGQTTDESGAVWYKVFLGGPKLAYVPAAALSLSGPVPSGYDGTSPDPIIFPTPIAPFILPS